MLVRLEGISKSYKVGESNFQALSSIDASIEQGEFLALVGPSGSGKSTLLNILGLIETPSAGRYVFKSTDVAQIPEDIRTEVPRQKIGFIFQTFNLLPILSTQENVEYPLLLKGMKEKEAASKAMQMLSLVGLSHVASHKPAQLSGGQRQRVAIARALVKDPVMVLADEPTANLDSKTGLDIIDLLSTLHRERGVTIVVATHDQRVASRAGRQLLLSDGRITESNILPQSQNNIGVGGF